MYTNRQLKKSQPFLLRQVDVIADAKIAEAIAATTNTKVDADAEDASEYIRKHLQTDLFR